MGQSLSEPITEKSTFEGNDKRVMYGISSMQGWRPTMEDAHTIIPSYADTGASFFAVFDGHGGDEVAKYSGRELHKKIMTSKSFAQKRYRDAIRIGHYAIDEDLRKDPHFDKDYSGSTAVTAMITKDNVLYVSNVGDSRAVISTKNGRGIPLTQDHKPRHPKEAVRIKNAGGFVENGRVNGSLALSRALGDFIFKSNTQLTPDLQAVTAEPDIIEHLLTDHDEFVVLACDGIWDCLTNQQVVDFVRHKLCEHKSLGPICEELMDYCLAETANMTGIGCDNMTVIIVAFLRKRKPQQWYDWMASKAQPPLPLRKPILIAPGSRQHLTASDPNTDATSIPKDNNDTNVSSTTENTPSEIPIPSTTTHNHHATSTSLEITLPNAAKESHHNTPLSSTPILPPSPPPPPPPAAAPSSLSTTMADAAKRHSISLDNDKSTSTSERTDSPANTVSNIMAASAATAKRQSILNTASKGTPTTDAPTTTTAHSRSAAATGTAPVRKVSFLHTPTPTPTSPPPPPPPPPPSSIPSSEKPTNASSPVPATAAVAK
ncbi:phosphatase 2C-like domain-containing protein [Mycotypha africana]|uniref:phosphatase 2C-like domain-containing protein n=1 Tax=Mycotypha africana TaxID=64632 RepID=UPI002301971A|nr:phosphatase 2C-like domain-containing protein [Mycotypha africana]KAI8988470.1 phosphatase 2C-like domain-containing protein [Mycotypha africana]